jgi:hypothetical protein
MKTTQPISPASLYPYPNGRHAAQAVHETPAASSLRLLAGRIVNGERLGTVCWEQGITRDRLLQWLDRLLDSDPGLVRRVHRAIRAQRDADKRDYAQLRHRCLHGEDIDAADGKVTAMRRATRKGRSA